MKLSKTLSIIFSLISLYSCAEQSKEAGGGNLVQFGIMVVMEFGIRGGTTGKGF